MGSPVRFTAIQSDFCSNLLAPDDFTLAVLCDLVCSCLPTDAQYSGAHYVLAYKSAFQKVQRAFFIAEILDLDSIVLYIDHVVEVWLYRFTNG